MSMRGMGWTNALLLVSCIVIQAPADVVAMSTAGPNAIAGNARPLNTTTQGGAHVAVSVAQAGSGQGVQQTQPRQTTVQRGIEVRPDTVTVGEPFILTVRVRAPLGSQIEFPVAPDTASGVELLDPRSIATSDTIGAIEQIAVYRMAAWDTDKRPFYMDDVVVTTPAGRQLVTLENSSVFVMSVLPEEAELRVPQPARDIFGTLPPWWWPWIPLLILIALIGGLLWWWWHRRNRKAASEPDVYEVALREFDRVEQMNLIEAGERGRHAALMADVLRDFLSGRLEGLNNSQTSREVMLLLHTRADVPVDRLEALLHEADLVKFARWPLSADRARTIGREAREIVMVIGPVLPPEPDSAEHARPAARDITKEAA